MGKILVAYFSASGTTAKLAANLALAINADLHEIQPQILYTREDLDWTNRKSRSSVEMNNKSFRPAIANRVENMDMYDTIFVAFPIWWYVAPTIINSFLEGYDFNGKTVIPLATSGGSGMGRTSRELVLSCPGAILKEGKVFSANTEKNRLAEWAAGITGEGNIKAQEKVREEYKKRQEALKKQQKETAPADASKRTGS